jgi:hypothetical protein
VRRSRHAERRAQQAGGTLPFDVPAGIDLRRRRSPVIQEGTRMSSRLSLMVASVALAFAASTAFAATQAADAGAKAPNAQQQRMTDCNKQATGKTGDERKAFMSSCLKGEAAAPAKMTQQEKMKACNADPQAKSLKGDARKQFMSTCLSNNPPNAGH